MLKIDINDREVRQALMEGSRERILAGKDWTVELRPIAAADRMRP